MKPFIFKAIKKVVAWKDYVSPSKIESEIFCLFIFFLLVSVEFIVNFNIMISDDVRGDRKLKTN